MKQFQIKTNICLLESAKEFCETFGVGKNDLLFISQSQYDRYFKACAKDARVVNYRQYGKGEPTDLMVEHIYQDIKNIHYDRVIAVGGGTILDVAKLFALKRVSPVVDLFEHKCSPEKGKELILVPTTCGTGSEVTNISILELTVRGTKLGLANRALYADHAVLIPELLSSLPARVFSASSIDALIHSVESYLSPKASAFTGMYSLQAVRMILAEYRRMCMNPEYRICDCASNMLYASTYAGIAFGNAGCGAVHAMSYPLGAKYHVAHGEANYAMFTGVLKAYQKKNPTGRLAELNAIIAEELESEPEEVYERLEEVLNHFLPKKALREYGVSKEELLEFTDIVMHQQTRLMNNNYVELSQKDVRGIYEALY